MEPILQVKGMGKSFSGVPALKGIDMEFYGGEVHAICGENGAGKSTLIKMISGIYGIDEGEMIYEGKRFLPQTPSDAIDAGISVIHQELSVITDLSVAENIFFGNAPTKMFGKVVDFKKLYKQTSDLLEELGIDLNPKEMVRNLNPAMQQMVEILRAISRNTKVIIMDEPTSSLSFEEVRILFEIINKLRDRNMVIIYISHRMDEIFELSKRISVLKDGRYIKTVNTEETSQQELVSLMVGRKLEEYYTVACEPKELIPVLEVNNLTRKGVFENITFTLHKGEVLGMSGLVGAGRTEVVRAIFGADYYDSGSVKIRGEECRLRHPSEAIERGIGLVPEDRRTQGILLDKSVRQNISLVNMKKSAKFGLINRQKEKEDAAVYCDKLKIKTTGIDVLLKKLSGGNQQKVAIAKWLCCNADILILDEPTRGIDVSAKSEIYSLIKEYVEADGGSVIIVSSELPEIIGICHRTIVMQEGKVTAILPREKMDETTIMQYSTTKEE